RVHAVMPVLSTERAARQRVLHDVEELPVAGEHLQLAIVEDVVGATDARCHLLREAEVDRAGARTIGWQELFVEAHAQVQCQPMPYGPAILTVDAVVIAGHLALCVYSVSNDEVTCISLAAQCTWTISCLVGRLDIRARSDAVRCARVIRLRPEKQRLRRVVALQ